MQKVEELVRDVKKKKELQTLSDDFIREEVKKYLQGGGVDFSPKSAKYKKIVKEIRSRLRRVYGLFRDKKQEALLNMLTQKELTREKLPVEKLVAKILATHASTKERTFYKELHTEINKLKPKVILDLGCGVNPLAFFKNKTKYYAYDINEAEINSMQEFFKKQVGFKGVVGDVLKLKYPKADLALLFKMTDVLDRGKGHKKSEDLIKRIPAKFIIVSFPTLTMSRKKMNRPRRKWIELMCDRLGYKYKVKSYFNEIFYVITK
jgi:hypothetical protein